MIRVATLALVLCLAGPALAQDAEPKTPAKAPQATATAEEFDVSEARWYRIRIVTGESILGLARPKRLWEVSIKGSRFDPVERDKEGSGIRLWYVERQLGFVFVPAKDVVGDPRDLGEATEDEARQIKEDRARAKMRAEEARKKAIEQTERLKEKMAEWRKNRGKKPEDGAQPGGKPEDSLTPAQKALLKKYPADTWSPNTPDKIQHRKTILGIMPTQEEKLFLETFDKWKAAYDALQDAKKKAEEAAKKAEATKGGTGSAVKPETPPAGESDPTPPKAK